jgi:DNA polymerase III epsilon subunit-like protein
MASGIKIDKVIAIDCETSGINFEANRSQCNESVAKNYQAVSWGLVIADADTFEIIDEMYIEVKWNGYSKWDAKAQAVHGLTKEYLEENGVEEEEAVVLILEFIIKHIDVKKPLYFLGHNIMSFDVPFFKDLLHRYGLKNIKIGHRYFDTFALSMGTVKEYDSNTLFERLGYKARDAHNALDDAKYALGVYRKVNKAWNQMLNGK